MPFSLVISANARRDIQQAIDWENSRSEHLGERFFRYLLQRFTILSDYPFIGSVRHGNVRCTATDVFQYLIYYIVEQKKEQVMVLRVLHMKRKPVM